MFWKVGFGAAPTSVSLKNYVSPVVPPQVTQFLKDGKLPDLRDVQDYEQTMVATINAVIGAASSFKPGDPTFSSAQKVSEDLNFFKSYMQFKMQVENGWTTPQASSTFYKTYYGSFTTYSQVTAWLGQQSALAAQEMMDTATLKVGDAVSQMSMAKLDFYTKKIVPIGSNFSSSDQQFLRDTFIMKMDGEVSLPDVVKALKMVAPYFTTAEFTAVSMFAPQMVLGSDLGTRAFISDAKTPSAQAAEITGNYNAIISKLGPYVPFDIGPYFSTFIAHVAKGETPLDGSDLEVTKRIMTAVQNGVMDAFKLTKDYGFAPSTPTASISAAIAQQTANLSPEARAMVTEATKNLNLPGAGASGGGFGVALLALAAGWYFLGRSKK